MVGRTAVVAAACCCLAGTAGAFLVPGPYFHKATPAKTRSVEVAMSAPPTLEGVPAEPGLKVYPTAWKWPRSWPYTSDYFSRKSESSIELNGTPTVTPFYDEKAAEALAGHYKRQLPANGAILELGASVNSYLPEDVTFSQVVGVGINEEEMSQNKRLTERLAKDLNADQTLPYQDGQFDAVLMANSIEFMVKPREVIREAFRCLKPGGKMIVSFGTKNKMAEDKQVKMWGNMNDDQRMWIIGSLYYFACGEGFSDLKGYDLSESDAKGMIAGLSGKTPCHIIQAVKADFPTDKSDIYRYMMAMLWSASDMDTDDKALVVSRIKADYDRAETEEEKDRLVASINYLPRIYGVLALMGGALPVQLRALLAASLAPLMHGTDDEMEQLKQGLGLSKASEEFWAPLGKATSDMTAEDKVLLLAECVPMHSGTEDEKAALTGMVEVVPRVIDVIKGVCPEMTAGDQQLLAVDLVVSDFLHVEAAERAQFMDWVKGLNKVDLEEYLRLRKEYKVKTAAI